MLLVHLGPMLVFVLHGVCCLISLIVQQLVVPETKGKSLQAIQLLLEMPKAEETRRREKMEIIDVLPSYDTCTYGSHMKRRFSAPIVPYKARHGLYERFNYDTNP